MLLIRSPDAIRGFAFRLCSTASSTVRTEKTASYFRTDEQDPRKHDKRHLGRIYNIPDTITSLPSSDTPEFVRNYRFFPPEFERRCRVFNESTLMVREPVLEVLDTIKRIDWEKLTCPLKFILYGNDGCGKTLSLCHLRHFVQVSEPILLNFSRMKWWLHRYNEIAESAYKPGRYDHIMDSQLFFRNFLHRNGDKVKGLKTHQKYVWSARENTESGSPLSDIIEQGIERPKFAADCLNVFLKELKLNANEGNCKLAIFIDGINPLYWGDTYVCKDWTVGQEFIRTWKVRQRLCHIDELSVMRSIKKLINNDYRNAMVIASVDKQERFPMLDHLDEPRRWWKARQINMTPDLDSHYPFALLGDEGSKIVDPFIPVEVKPFSEAELDVMIDYYIEKRYIKDIAGTEAGRREIKFLTGGNGSDFFNYSNMW